MLPLVAVLGFALLSMAALAIDIGFAAVQQQRLEAAAEAMSAGALREELRLRHLLIEDLATADSLGCGSAELDACIAARANDYGRRLAERVHPRVPLEVGIDPVVDLGPGEIDHSGDRCAGEPLTPGLVPTACDPDAFSSLTPSAIAPPALAAGGCDPVCWRATLTQAVPLLFGHGSMLALGEDETIRSLLDAREDGRGFVGDGTPTTGALRTRGIPIRGLAGSVVAPVVAIGADPVATIPVVAPAAVDADGTGDGDDEPLLVPVGLPYRAPFAIDIRRWRDAFPVGPSSVVALTVDGALLSLQQPVGESPELEVGRLLPAGAALLAGRTVDASAGASEVAPLQDEERLAYVPLTLDDVVVGYGLASIEVDATNGLVLVTRHDAPFAPGNASASPRMLVRRPVEPAEQAVDVALVLGAQRDARYADLLVRAPVPR